MRPHVWGCALALATAVPAISQTPFGIRMGQPASTIPGAHLASDQRFIFVVSPPEPNPEFEAYEVIATPQTGVCKVVGIGRDHANDSSGSDTRSMFAHLKDVLTEKYGPSKDFDFLHAGSIWNGPNEWVMAVHQNERSLASFWDKESGANFPEPLENAALEVKATSSNSSYVTINYEFKNYSSCKSIMDAATNSSL